MRAKDIALSRRRPSYSRSARQTRETEGLDRDTDFFMQMVYTVPRTRQRHEQQLGRHPDAHPAAHGAYPFTTTGAGADGDDSVAGRSVALAGVASCGIVADAGLVVLEPPRKCSGGITPFADDSPTRVLSQPTSALVAHIS